MYAPNRARHRKAHARKSVRPAIQSHDRTSPEEPRKRASDQWPAGKLGWGWWSPALYKAVEHTLLSGLLKIHRQLVAFHFRHHAIAEFLMENTCPHRIIRNGQGIDRQYALD